jgi:hypothetical protein
MYCGHCFGFCTIYFAAAYLEGIKSSIVIIHKIKIETFYQRLGELLKRYIYYHNTFLVEK